MSAIGVGVAGSAEGSLEDSWMSKASLAQVLHIGGMFERGEYDREMAHAIINKRIAIVPEERRELRPFHYTVRIASAIPPTFAELEANYGKGNVTDLWDLSKHEIDYHESLEKMFKPYGKAVVFSTDITVFLMKFDRPTITEEAVKWADEHNYRLVFPWEREAFSKAYPDLQRKFCIVDLGSSALNDCGSRCSPTLLERPPVPGDQRSVSRRFLGGFDFSIESRPSDRFLFACK